MLREVLEPMEILQGKLYLSPIISKGPSPSITTGKTEKTAAQVAMPAADLAGNLELCFKRATSSKGETDILLLELTSAPPNRFRMPSEKTGRPRHSRESVAPEVKAETLVSFN